MPRFVFNSFVKLAADYTARRLPQWLIARLAEPSTHAAVAAVLIALYPFLPQPDATVVAIFFGALGFAIPEKKG